jgi:hypothetical protein
VELDDDPPVVEQPPGGCDRQSDPGPQRPTAGSATETTRSVSVADDVDAGPAGDLDSGKGLAGMRERAAALGGSLHAGPRAGGGFSVSALLPTRGPIHGGAQ